MPTGDSSNLWQIGLSRLTGHVVGSPQRLTTGAGRDMHASCADDGTLVYSQVDVRTDLWLFPVDLERGAVTGPPERITHGVRDYPSPSLARNGRFIAFASDQSGPLNIWIRDLQAATEVSVAASSFTQQYAVLSASGAAVAYSVFENDKRAVYVSAPGGVPDRVCEGCLRATDWSGDQKTLVIFGGSPYQINLLDVASHRQTPLVRHPDASVLYGRLSPDSRWIAFTERVQHTRARIMIAPIDGAPPVPEHAWIPIADVEPDDYAQWSPDGNMLYFTSRKDGYSCLWTQRIDPTSRRPVGDAFAVQHFHGRKSFGRLGWSAAANRIAIPLVETTGDLWMMSRPGR